MTGSASHVRLCAQFFLGTYGHVVACMVRGFLLEDVEVLMFIFYKVFLASLSMNQGTGVAQNKNVRTLG